MDAPSIDASGGAGKLKAEGKGGSLVGKLAAGAATVGAAFGAVKLSGKGGAKANAEV